MLILICLPTPGRAAAPPLPFELAAPKYPVIKEAPEDTATSLRYVYSQGDDLAEYMKAYLTAYWSDTDLDEFFGAYGFKKIEVFIQVDWAIDDITDWHYNEYWDCKNGRMPGCDDDGCYRGNAFDTVMAFTGYDTTYSATIFRFFGDPTDELNYDWNGVSRKTGLKDVLKEGQYYFDTDAKGNSTLRIDYTAHNVYTRSRFLVNVEYEDGENGTVRDTLISDWSKLAVYGKDAPEIVFPTHENLDPPVISDLRVDPDAGTLSYSVAIPEDQMLSLNRVYADGAAQIYTDVRVNKIEWLAIEPSCLPKNGVITLELTRLKLEYPDLVIDENTFIEAECYIEGTYTYNEELNWFITDNSNVISAGTVPSLPGDVNGDEKLSVRDVAMMMRAQAGWTQSGYFEENEDFNTDGRFNAKDIALLMRALASDWD